MNNFDTDYFIAKFSPIPDDQWTTGEFVNDNGARCALGHCGCGRRLWQDRDGESKPEEPDALRFLFHVAGAPAVTAINDNKPHIMTYFSDNERAEISSCKTPKARVLLALNWIKAGRTWEQE